MGRPLLNALSATARETESRLAALAGEDPGSGSPPDAVVLLRDVTDALAAELRGLTVRIGPLAAEGPFGGIERRGKLVAVTVGEDTYELPRDAALRIPAPGA